MKRLLLSALATVSLLSPLACDLEKTTNQLKADHVIVGTLLATPQVDVSASAMAGYDAGTFGGPDGGDVVNFPGQTAAFVFFGTKSGENAQPQGVSGATVTLNTGSSAGVPLNGQGGGSYGVTSDSTDDLTYASGATYSFFAEQNGTKYEARVEDAPTKEAIAKFHPEEGFVRHDANTAFAFDRPAPPANQDRTLGFVTVVPLGANGEKGQATYSNVPTSPVEFLQLAATPALFREARVTIPATAFPNPKQTYLVIFQAVRMGGPESDNLFLGSVVLAGTAEVGIVRTN
ncbi:MULTISPECIES: hypothetical protein [unclassified Corallococcus]|uniref:hypothetical protein n=1 Tax=unclassified Corallococcus TaxID=2685029 RepID=UPI001A8F3AD8|nr:MULTISPECIES: hypothetical protein [unclassified Corallococcus]MBN9684072.1 hypothetical protein [Corallococcus sp. NCSPR001]WAS84434.1 hypothetical protein O0N60_34810 [Corallococcus sp. NCRR]